MHVLITGGSGFIGQRLCPALLAAGHRLSVLTRDPLRASKRLPKAVACVTRLDEATGVDAVINLQGENLGAGRWSEARKREFVRSRVDFTRELVAWTGRARVKTLINGSAIGWYGSRGNETLTENATPGSDFAAQLCRDWESAALGAVNLGLRVCCLRIGVVLDRDGGALARMLPAFRLGGGGPIGPGTQWMSWITRDDLVRLILWLLDTPGASGVYNATAPAPVSNRDFGQALGRALHRPAVLPMPALVVRTLFGEMADLLLGSQRVLPQRALAQGFAFEHPALDGALHSILAR